MKTLFSLIAVFFTALLVPFESGAQVSFGPVPLLTGGTNNVAATATNTYSAKLIGTTLANDAVVYVSAKGLDATPNGVVTFVFKKSPDGASLNPTTDTATNLVLTLNGTTVASASLNFNVQAYGGIFLTEIRSTNGVALTNLTVTGYVKNRPVR